MNVTSTALPIPLVADRMMGCKETVFHSLNPLFISSSLQLLMLIVCGSEAQGAVALCKGIEHLYIESAI